MKKTHIIFILLLLALASLGMVNSAGNSGLKFSHKLHMQDVGAGCLDCHAPADSSASPMDNLLPNVATCNQCHEDTLACTYCHENKDVAKALPRITHYISQFPHKTHITNNMQCTDCHVGVDSSADIITSHLPGMQSCIECHTDLDKPDYCNTCHKPGEDRRPADHKVNWMALHGTDSYTNKDNCNVCHTDNYCLECHRGDNLDHKVHPLNFTNNHFITAKSNSDQCYVCHEEQSFCLDCHRTELVLPKSHSYAGWSNKVTGGTHKTAAQFNLDGCLSCHNDINGEPICAECHTEKVDD